MLCLFSWIQRFPGNLLKPSSLHAKILRIRRYVHDKNPWDLLGIQRPDIDSILRDSEPIIPSPYSRSRDVWLRAGISLVNRSSNVESFTENDDRSSIPIRNPSLCENKDYFEHKMYQPRFISHVLGAHYRRSSHLRLCPIRSWSLRHLCVLFSFSLFQSGRVL
jgi:hypothetical protein